MYPTCIEIIQSCFSTLLLPLLDFTALLSPPTPSEHLHPQRSTVISYLSNQLLATMSTTKDDAAKTTSKTTTKIEKKDECNIDRRKLIIGVSVAVLAAAVAIPLAMKFCSGDEEEEEKPATVASAKLAFTPSSPQVDFQAVNHANTQSL